MVTTAKLIAATATITADILPTVVLDRNSLPFTLTEKHLSHSCSTSRAFCPSQIPSSDIV